jgi:hypothetical protein
MFRTVLIALVVMAFAATTARAESAEWLGDYIEKGPSKQLTKTTPEKASPAPAAKAPKTKVGKRVAKAQAKKRAKASKRRRR